MFLAQVVLLETPIQEATPCGLAPRTLLLKLENNIESTYVLCCGRGSDSRGTVRG